MGRSKLFALHSSFFTTFMYTTLDHLEKITYKKKRSKRNLLSELKVIAVIVGISTFFLLIFTNAQLFFGDLVETFSPEKEAILNRDEKTIAQDNSIAQMVQTSAEEIKGIHNMIDQFKNKNTEEKNLSYSSKSELKSKVKDYPFTFNTLPPTNRLIIPSSNLDIPLITSAYKEMDDFNNGKFDEELNHGVVKYPTTPEPGEEGNTLIFGHTSTEYRKKNPYGTIFKDIPTLQNGEVVQVIREGQLHKYKIVDHRIVYPKEVNKTYLEFQNKKKDYITLMGCYPIGKATKRYLVIAEEIE